MDREQLKSVLPHREPMLLIDEVALCGEVSVAKYTVRGDEFFLQGHFPGQPVVPGVILCEMMGQSTCLLFEADKRGLIPYFAAMNHVRFKSKVVPGDTVVFKSRMVTQKNMIYVVKSAGYVGDALCVSGELTFVLAEKDTAG